MDFMIDFKQYSNAETSMACLEEWSQDNKNSDKALIVFNIKRRNWYICAYASYS
jgi:hypothetical protein